MNTAFSSNDTLAIKGIAILLMLFHHLFFEESAYKAYDIVPLITDHGSLMKYALMGKLCVPIFVFLAGYGFSRSYSRILQGERERERERELFRTNEA